MGDPLRYGPGAQPVAGALANGPVLGSPIITPSTQNGVLIAGGAAAPVTSTAVGANGQVLTGKGVGNPPAFTVASGGTLGFAGIAPAGPTVTSPATMAGMGAAPANCIFTPSRSGRLLLIFTGHIICPINAIAGSGIQVGLYWGSGTPPANGAALTGTSISSPRNGVVGIAQGPSFQAEFPFTVCGFISTAVVGTTYWADLSQALTVVGSPAVLNNVNFTFLEQ